MNVLAAMEPSFIVGRPTIDVLLRVWFDEWGPDQWCWFVATPFDVEPHGKRLWIRAMAGQYGPFVPPRQFDIFKGAVIDDTANRNL